MSLSGSLSTQDHCGQGRAITDSLDLGGDDEVGEQGRDVSGREGPLFHIPTEAHQAMGQKCRAISGLIFLTHPSEVRTILDNIVDQGP